MPKVRGRSLLPNKPYAVVRLFKKEPKLRFRGSCLSKGHQYTYSTKWGEVKEGFFLLPLDSITSTAIVVPNIGADPECSVECPEPLGGGYFVLPSRSQLGEDFLDVIERESDDIGDNRDEDGEDEDSDNRGEDSETEDNAESEDSEEEPEDEVAEEEAEEYNCRRIDFLQHYIALLNLD